jgi:ferredoxin
MSLIKLFSLDKEVEVGGNHPNLLAGLEANKVEVEYQCREGYCGSCRCRLLKGEVEWVREPLAFVSKGEILPCCVKPKGDIEIDL